MRTRQKQRVVTLISWVSNKKGSTMSSCYSGILIILLENIYTQAKQHIIIEEPKQKYRIGTARDI